MKYDREFVTTSVHETQIIDLTVKINRFKINSIQSQDQQNA